MSLNSWQLYLLLKQHRYEVETVILFLILLLKVNFEIWIFMYIIKYIIVSTLFYFSIIKTFMEVSIFKNN